MLTEIAKIGLREILHYSSAKDVKIMELKLVEGDLKEKSVEAMIEDMLSSASQPSQILRQQRLRKRVLSRYLYNCGIPVTQEQGKSDYIRICLEMWQVTDDYYLWRFRSDQEIAAEIDRFEESMRQSLGELKRRLRERRPSTNVLGAMQRSMKKILEVINTVGSTATTSPSESEVSIPPLSRSSSERDDDSSSNSSVEILECTVQSPDTLSLSCSSFMDTTDPWTPPTASTSKTASSGTSKTASSGTSKTASSGNASAEASPSKPRGAEATSEQGTSSKVRGAETTSEQGTPSKMRATGTALNTSEHKSPSKRSPTKRSSQHIKEEPDSRYPKQTSLLSYFNGTDKR